MTTPAILTKLQGMSKPQDNAKAQKLQQVIGLLNTLLSRSNERNVLRALDKINSPFTFDDFATTEEVRAILLEVQTWADKLPDSTAEKWQLTYAVEKALKKYPAPQPKTPAPPPPPKPSKPSEALVAVTGTLSDPSDLKATRGLAALNLPGTSSQPAPKGFPLRDPKQRPSTIPPDTSTIITVAPPPPKPAPSRPAAAPTPAPAAKVSTPTAPARSKVNPLAELHSLGTILEGLTPLIRESAKALKEAGEAFAIADAGQMIFQDMVEPARQEAEARAPKEGETASVLAQIAKQGYETAQTALDNAKKAASTAKAGLDSKITEAKAFANQSETLLTTFNKEMRDTLSLLGTEKTDNKAPSLEMPKLNSLATLVGQLNDMLELANTYVQQANEALTSAQTTLVEKETGQSTIEETLAEIKRELAEIETLSAPATPDPAAILKKMQTRFPFMSEAQLKGIVDQQMKTTGSLTSARDSKLEARKTLLKQQTQEGTRKLSQASGEVSKAEGEVRRITTENQRVEKDIIGTIERLIDKQTQALADLRQTAEQAAPATAEPEAAPATDAKAAPQPEPAPAAEPEPDPAIPPPVSNGATDKFIAHVQALKTKNAKTITAALNSNSPLMKALSANIKAISGGADKPVDPALAAALQKAQTSTEEPLERLLTLLEELMTRCGELNEKGNQLAGNLLGVLSRI